MKALKLNPASAQSMPLGHDLIVAPLRREQFSGASASGARGLLPLRR